MLAAGALALTATALPSAAQETDPTTTTTTAPVAPSATMPSTSEPPPTASAPTTTEAATEPTSPTTSPPATGSATTAHPAGPAPAPAGAATDDSPATTTVPAPPGAVEAQAVDIELAPATDLVDGDLLTVSITGLGPEAWVRAVQCPVGAVDVYNDCDVFGESYTTADASGTATLAVRANARIWRGWSGGEPVDCRTGDGCTLTVTTDGDGIVAQVPLSFAPDGPLAPPPTASIAPDGLLSDAQSVEVHASGFVWSSQVLLVQCRAGAPITRGDCDQDVMTSGMVGHDGSVATPLQVFAEIALPTGETVDCRPADACVIVATPDYLQSPEKQAVVPLTFDPATEIVRPTLTATPDTDLVDGQTVTVTGEGFMSGYVFVNMCAPGATFYDDCLGSDTFAEVDGTGSFSVRTKVSALVPTATGEVDCRTSADPCVLIATSGSITSARAGRADLHFDPEAPLLPGPAVTVAPDRDLGDEATITITGTNFGSTEGYPALLEVCRVGDASLCDEQTSTELTPDNAGGFAVELAVAATFPTWSGTTVDCREAPGCEVVARLGYQGRRATAPLAFGPPGNGGERYLDLVFDDVEVTSGIVYRHTSDAAGTGVDLTLDVYQPAGDTEDQRPVVVWLTGGWFGGGAGPDMGAYAEAFARRGYVSVTMNYRQRPGLRCCPTDDIEGVTAAITDAAADAGAGVAWLRDRADEYGIDPDAIAVGGHEGGAAAAFGLAHLPGQSARATGTSIAAALPIAGVDLGRPDPGEAPFLAFHGSFDNTAPLHLSTSACDRARAGGTPCGAVGYPVGWGGGLASSRQRDIVRRSADFLAEVVLDPLGYLEWTGPTTPTGPTDPGGGGDGGRSDGGGGAGGNVPIVPAPAVLSPGVAVAGPVARAAGTLPRTGAGLARLAAVALGLTAVGGASLLARRRQLQVGDLDAGDARLVAAAALAIVTLTAAAFGAVTLLEPDSGSDGDAESAAVHRDHDDDDHDDHADGDHDTETGGHPLGTHGVAHGPGTGHHDGDHDTGDHGTDDHDTDTDEHAAHPPAGTPAGVGHEHGTGTNQPGTPPHAHPSDPAHPHPTHPGPTHPHPTVPTDPPDPTPEPGFDPSWTPEQVAFAQALIVDTETQLERYANVGVLPLLGYQWIFDGKGVDEYQHWINLGRIVDADRLHPARPESLVLRNTADGPVVEAAMYMLDLGFHMGNIPADIAWLPGWHIHDNLCFGPNYELYGVTVDGVCERGNVLPTPPMIHVWRVDTRCGRFAGVDEFGLQCDHHHEH